MAHRPGSQQTVAPIVMYRQNADAQIGGGLNPTAVKPGNWHL
jgi:hypothetical protein